MFTVDIINYDGSLESSEEFLFAHEALEEYQINIDADCLEMGDTMQLWDKTNGYELIKTTGAIN